ncbi:MAG: Ig-like domain-containing protein, partial [Actinomycetota bacterium]|nr:Ig-like domain-containing protein [Actinomycetota bacterium]
MRRVLMLLVLVMLVAACSGGPAGPLGVNAAPRPEAHVSILPGDKATNVNPTLPVSVQVTGGALLQVALANPEGRAVTGTLSADRRSWTSTEPLGYGKTYTWSGTAAGSDHLSVPVTGSFSTVTPKEQPHATLNIGDGETVGVAAPI